MIATSTLDGHADALARVDGDGDPLPGDRALAEAYDRLCRDADDALLAAEVDRQYRDWVDAHRADCEDGEDCQHLT